MEIAICAHVKTDFVEVNGPYITVFEGYCWDGASGPTIDTDTSMEPSLVHDALCQLIQMGKIPEHKRKVADKIFKNLCLRAGMVPPRASIWYRMLRVFGGIYSHFYKKPVTYTVDLIGGK